MTAMPTWQIVVTGLAAWLVGCVVFCVAWAILLTPRRRAERAAERAEACREHRPCRARQDMRRQ